MFRINIQNSPVNVLEKLVEVLKKCYQEYHIEFETENNQTAQYITHTLHYYYHTIPTETIVTIDSMEKEIEMTIKHGNGREDSSYYIGCTIRTYLINHHLPVITSTKRSREGSIDESIKKAPPPSPSIRPLKEGKKVELSVGTDEMMNDMFVNIVRDAKMCSYDKKEHIYESIASFSETEQGRLFLMNHIPFLLESITLPSLFEDCKITRTINRCAATALANVLESFESLSLNNRNVSPTILHQIDQTVKKATPTSIKMRRECARILGHIILLQLSNL